MLGAACSVAGPTAISIISGGHYHPSLAMSAVLAFAMMTMLAAVPAYVSLIARGRSRAVAIVSLAAATVNIAGNLALAPYYGTSSAAVLTLLGYLISAWRRDVRRAQRTWPAYPPGTCISSARITDGLWRLARP